MVLKNGHLFLKNNHTVCLGEAGDGNDGQEGLFLYIHYGYRMLYLYAHDRRVRETGKEIDGNGLLRERSEKGDGAS
jgi:hypothetical protein